MYMNGMKSIKRISAAMLAAATLIGSAALPVSAGSEPYQGYNYGWWGDAVPSQNGYIVDRVVSAEDLGLEQSFSDPNDMFIFSKTGEIYIVDSNRNRIVIADGDLDASKTRVIDTFTYGEDYYLDKSKIGTTTFLNHPTGVFVLDDDGTTLIYIADFTNGRVLACYENGEVWMEYTRPVSDVYPDYVSFNPEKVLVDKAKNVYICIPSITTGAVVFAEDGTFNSFFGANRVEATAEIVYRQILRMFMSREQLSTMRRAVPIEFSNFDIDKEGFIYTVTESRDITTDVFKKLNPAGTNVFVRLGYDQYTFGDPNSYYVNGQTYTNALVDVDIDPYGNCLLLDRVEGRIFQYNDDCDLMFIFGAYGNQKGAFISPVALETYGTNVYVLDSRKATITVYKRTEFGALVHEAMTLFLDGFYFESAEVWEEVIKRDAGNYSAYVCLGNAYYEAGDYEKAMEYFYQITRDGYGRAFKEYRLQLIQNNFTWFVGAVLVLIVGIIVLDTVLRRRRKRKLAAQMREAQKADE
jgi:tetratricopeptide (TPR) repeat protein